MHTRSLLRFQAEKRGHSDVRLETFDEKVIKAYKTLHPLTPDLE